MLLLYLRCNNDCLLPCPHIYIPIPMVTDRVEVAGHLHEYHE